MKRTQTQRLCLAGLFLALALVLPFLTGQIPEVGSLLLPMHIPVLLCGILCGWPYGLAVGLIAPLFRHLLFQMPPLMSALCMTAELAAYGGLVGALYALLPKNVGGLYASLIIALLGGRVIWGIASIGIYALFSKVFSWELFLSGAFLTAWPGIVLQLILIPCLVTVLQRVRKHHARNSE